MHYPCNHARTFRVILFSFIVTNGNPSSVNIKQHCGSVEWDLVSLDVLIVKEVEVVRLEITTLSVRPAPPSPDHTLALYCYLLDSGDDSSDENLSETAESLHTQNALTSVVHPPPTRPLPTSPAFYPSIGKRDLDATRLQSNHESMESCITIHLSSTTFIREIIIIITIITLEIIIFSTTITLPSSSCKRSRSPSPSSVSPSTPPTAVPPLLEHIELVRDDIEASFWHLERHLCP
ncbi:hypothetical protein Tco_0375491 [Tanacetum coccineum]